MNACEEVTSVKIPAVCPLIGSLMLTASAAAQPVSNTTFVAFDVETTGLDATNGRVVEIAAVRFNGGGIEKKMTWLINPGIRIPWQVQRIHGISKEMVAKAPVFPEVFDQFVEFAGDAVLIAHNAHFDRRFIAQEIKRNDLIPPANSILDSLPLSRKWFPNAESHSLSNLTAYLLIQSERHHRALPDAENLARVFLAGLDTMPKDASVEDLVKLAGKTLQF